jgi:hypothetical protein
MISAASGNSAGGHEQFNAASPSRLVNRLRRAIGLLLPACIVVGPNNDIAVDQRRSLLLGDVLERKRSYTKFPGEISLRFTFEPHCQADLIAAPERAVHIQRLWEAAIAGIPNSIDDMLPSELLLGSIFAFLSRSFMLEPDLAKTGAVGEFSHCPEAPARQPLPNAFCGNRLLMVDAPGIFRLSL